MILESYYWRKELSCMMDELVSCFRFLAKHACRFDRHPIFNRIVERKEYVAERDLLLSAFIVRTLFEAGKLSDEMADYELNIVSYPATPKNTNKLMPLFRRFPDDDLYDYDRPSQLSIPGRRFVNQLIHAAVIPCFDFGDNTRPAAFMVVSDRFAQKCLYRCELDVWVKFVREVVHDEVNSIQETWDEAKSEWKIKRSRKVRKSLFSYEDFPIEDNGSSDRVDSSK